VLLEQIILQLRQIPLQDPFPYADAERIESDFASDFEKLTDEENGLTSDFNTYCMNIAGTLSYVLNDKFDQIPSKQIDYLQLSFFDWFPQYKFIEARLDDYKEFKQEYVQFEYARTLLLVFLTRLQT